MVTILFGLFFSIHVTASLSCNGVGGGKLLPSLKLLKLYKIKITLSVITHSIYSAHESSLVPVIALL